MQINLIFTRKKNSQNEFINVDLIFMYYWYKDF